MRVSKFIQIFKYHFLRSGVGQTRHYRNHGNHIGMETLFLIEIDKNTFPMEIVT